MKPSILSSRVSVSVAESVWKGHDAGIHSVRGYMEQIIFDSWCLCCLLLIQYVSNFLSSGMSIFKKIYSHTFFQRYYSYFNRILARQGLYFRTLVTWPNCQAHWICFRREVAATYCFKGNGFSVHNTSYLVRIRYSLDSYYFETDYFEAAAATSLKQLLFCNKNFFTTPTYLEQLILFSSYFLVTNISSNQLLFEDKSFFSRNTASEEVLLQNK